MSSWTRFWGQDPPASAEGGIYTYVAGLRRIIEPGRSLRGPGRVLVSSGAGYVLHLVPGQPDAVAFEQQLVRARQLRKNGDQAGAVTALESALGLWRGVAFAGVPGPFAETERVRLAELRSTAAEERADVLLALARHEEVVPDLTAMVADHPLRERMRGLLMIALYRSGRPAEALRVFQDGRRVLAEELGIDPGSELSRIHQQVLTSDPALDLPAADGQALTVAHRNGDAQASQSAADRTLPKGALAGPRGLRGSDGSSLPGMPSGFVPVPAQLPLDAPGFSGRREELAALHAMLPPARPAGAEDPVPVVIVSGTAGVGKTALAIHFGRQVAKRFPDGQLYVNLRGRDPGQQSMEPAEALGYLVNALGIPSSRIAVPLDERAALFRSLVDGKRVLIVLDNASNAAQVRPLLPGSPGCLVVVTSRNQMAGLVAAEGAALVELDVLGDAEAHEMLARRLGQDRVAAEAGAADEIIEACARLPLALSVAVGRAGVRPLPASAGRAGSRTARRQEQAGRARGRRRGHRHARGALLVLRPAQPGRRADVPAARAAPGLGRLGVGGGQPGRDPPGRGRGRAARAGPDAHGHRVRVRPVHLPRPASRVRGRPGRAARRRARARRRHAPRPRPLPAHGDVGLAAVQPVPFAAAAGPAAAGRAARPK